MVTTDLGLSSGSDIYGASRGDGKGLFGRVWSGFPGYKHPSC